MSLSCRDRMGVALYPDRLVSARVGGMLRDRAKAGEALALDEAAPGTPPWRPAVDALSRRVAEGWCEGADVTLVLSSRFLRYVLIPWSEALRADDEQLAYARERCAAIYGLDAGDWAVHACPAVPGEPRVACAVEGDLLAALEEAMRPLKARYRSAQPHLIACFNRWRRHVTGAPEWLVVHEPGLLCVALLCRGQWRSLRCVTVGPEWRARLAGVLTREQCMSELSDPVTRVLLVEEDAGGEEALPALASWRVERLAPRAGGAAASSVWSAA